MAEWLCYCYVKKKKDTPASRCYGGTVACVEQLKYWTYNVVYIQIKFKVKTVWFQFWLFFIVALILLPTWKLAFHLLFFVHLWSLFFSPSLWFGYFKMLRPWFKVVLHHGEVGDLGINLLCIFVCLCMFGHSTEPNVSTKVVLVYRKWQVTLVNQPYSHWNP